MRGGAPLSAVVKDAGSRRNNEPGNTGCKTLGDVVGPREVSKDSSSSPFANEYSQAADESAFGEMDRRLTSLMIEKSSLDEELSRCNFFACTVFFLKLFLLVGFIREEAKY